MIKLNWEQQRPKPAEVAKMWQEITFTPITLQHQMVDHLVSTTKGFMAECFFQSFQISENSCFDWFASRNRLNEIDFFYQFLTSETVGEVCDYDVQSVQLVSTGYTNWRNYAKREQTNPFHWGSPFTLDGEIAAMLVSGGAYRAFEGTPQQAKDLGTQVFYELFQERYLDIVVYRSNNPWSEWFCGVYCDGTWMMLDKLNRYVHWLCYTDSD